MKFGNFVPLLFLIYETSFYLVMGQTINEEKNDCTKLYNFLYGDNKLYSMEDCCSKLRINCYQGYITEIAE